MPYVRLDGVRVADSFDDLSDGSILAPININEKFRLTIDNVWFHCDSNYRLYCIEQ